MQEQLQWRADLLMAGRYKDLSREYLFPCVIYLDGNPIVASGMEAQVSALAEMRATLLDRKVHRCVSTVVAIEMPRNGRLRVWARWQELSLDPQMSQSADAIYYLRKTSYGYRSEMLDFRQSTHGDQHDGFPEQRLLA